MKPYTDAEVNDAITRVETAKQTYPVGWRYLRELNLPADPMVAYAYRLADIHTMRLAQEDNRLIYATGWLQGLSIGVALGESRDRWRAYFEQADAELRVALERANTAERQLARLREAL